MLIKCQTGIKNDAKIINGRDTNEYNIISFINILANVGNIVKKIITLLLTLRDKRLILHYLVKRSKSNYCKVELSLIVLLENLRSSANIR